MLTVSQDNCKSAPSSSVNSQGSETGSGNVASTTIPYDEEFDLVCEL